MNILKYMPGETARIKSAWNTIKNNWLISIVHKFTFILFVLSILLFVLRYTRLPPLVPIWYSRPWGLDQMAPPYVLLVLPIGSLVIYGINVLISVYVTAEYLIFTQMLFVSSLIVSLLSSYALIKILFLVT